MNHVRLLVVGAGYLGSRHAKKIAALEHAVLVGIVDSNADAAKNLADSLGVPSSTSLADFSHQADAAIIATPTTTHRDVAMQAMDLGLHVLVEKPLAHTLHDATDLVAYAQHKKCILQVGHVERFNPAVQIASHIATNTRYFVAERLGPFSGRSFDIDVVLDLMIHDLDIMLSMIESPIKEIRAIGVPIVTHAIDMAAVRLECDNGAVAQLSAGRASLNPSRKLRFFTTERYISVNCLTLEVKSVQRLPPEQDAAWPSIIAESIDVDHTYDAMHLQDQDFIQCIIQHKQPKVDGYAGIRAMQLADAIKKVIRHA